MSEASTQITLIGTKLATVGMEFTFNGSTPECETCKLRNTCMNLEPARRYRVLGTRGELIHECPIHEAGVRAVEVTEILDRCLVADHRYFAYTATTALSTSFATIIARSWN
jgi:uncharacterized protein (UPF0179 family)